MSSFLSPELAANLGFGVGIWMLGMTVVAAAELDWDEAVLEPGCAGAALYYGNALGCTVWAALQAKLNPAYVLALAPPLVSLCVGWKVRGKPVAAVRFELRMTTLYSGFSVLMVGSCGISHCVIASSLCCEEFVSEAARWALFSGGVFRIMCTPLLLWVWQRAESVNGATRSYWICLWLMMGATGFHWLMEDVCYAAGDFTNIWGTKQTWSSYDDKGLSDGIVPGLQVRLVGVVVFALFLFIPLLWLCLHRHSGVVYGMCRGSSQSSNIDHPDVCYRSVGHLAIRQARRTRRQLHSRTFE